MDTLKYEITDRNSSLKKYDFFLNNMQAEATLEALVKDVLKTKPVARVFDIGCGDAQALRELKSLFGKKVVVCGADALPADGLDEFVLGNAAKKSFPKKCDIVVSFRAMHEIAHLQKVFSKISGCMSMGALGFISIRIQQEVGPAVFFHGDLQQKDIEFLKKIGKLKKFMGMRVLVIFVRQKTRSKKKIIAGANVFLSKK